MSSGDPATRSRREEGPKSRRDAWAWVVFGFAGYAAGQVLALVLLAVVASLVGHGGDYTQLANRSVPPGWVVVTELIGLWIGFVGAVVVASRRRGTQSIVADMGLRFRPRDFLVGPAVGLAGQLALIPLLYLPLEHSIANFRQRMAEPANHLTGGFPGADLAVIGALTVLVVPIVEELLFRGLLLQGLLGLSGRLGSVLGPALACVASGVAFGLAHFELLQLLGLSAFGTVLAVLALKTRRLGASILAHATFNLVAIVALAVIIARP